MSIILVPGDLATYLGVDTVAAARATQILGLAQALCESVTSPLPVGAEVVVLDVAARAWNNPKGAQSASNTAGPFSQTTSYPGVAGGLYLTRENKATLRRLTTGSSSVFTIGILTPTVPASSFGWDTWPL